ncbi:hypothetical protein J4Q44_G00384060 [Coregonus suidteri]|uniref:Uncharacterized protein n=1 Tax=Coregonus suidteri TaxID=861788 RepID=A0AAN8KLD3_9TELE
MKLTLSLCSTEKVEPKEQPAPEKRSLAQPPEKEATQERKATHSFLQKLREAGQSKPACPRKALASPVREPPLTELEDDFLILEDYEPPWFSHRWKFDPIRTTAKPRPKQQNQSHSSDNASADILTKATANQRSGGTDRPRTTKEKKGKNPTTRKERDSSPPGVGPQGDGPVNHVDLEADHIEQDKKKVNNLLSEPTTAGDLEQEAPGGGAKPKPSHTKTEKKVPRISKSKAGIQGDKVNPKTSRGRGRQSGKTRRLSGRAGDEAGSLGRPGDCQVELGRSPSPWRRRVKRLQTNHQLKTRMFLQFYSWHQQDRDESSLRFQPIVRPRRSAPPLLVRLTPPS